MLPAKPKYVAAVNSSGIGGTYAHVVIESTSRVEPRRSNADAQVMFVVSARGEASVRDAARKYAEHLKQGTSLADFARTISCHRQAMDWCAPIQGRNRSQVVDALEQVARGEGRVERRASGVPRVAFLYAGQATQYAGMGRSLYEQEDVFRAALDECAGPIASATGQQLAALLWGDDAEAFLQRTAFAQPALFAFAYALTKLWKSWGVNPSFVIGHSLGEYVAAHVAGVFSLADALELVCTRGRLMDSMDEKGAMVAIPADVEQVQAWVAAYGQSLSVAASNSPTQTVVSGPEHAIAAFRSHLEQRGVSSRLLAGTYGFHSCLMDPILPAFEEAVTRVPRQPPSLRLISTLTGAVAGDELCSARYWRDQLRQTVRFEQALKSARSEGADVFVEIGPQAVLQAAQGRLDTGARWVASGHLQD